VSFGNQLDVKDAKLLLHRCREAGVNFFDNAEVYANGRAEEIMGAAIKELGWKRSDIVISTKLFWGGQGPNDKGLSRKHIIEGIKVPHTHTHLSLSLSVAGVFQWIHWI
jgi:aryl-alcohol dehydrogenase-like predicted oxidoreductase